MNQQQNVFSRFQSGALAPPWVIVLGAVLFCAAMVVYSGRVVGIDSQATLATGVSIVRHGDWNTNTVSSLLWISPPPYGPLMLTPEYDVFLKKPPLNAILHIPLIWLGSRLPFLGIEQLALMTVPLMYAMTGILMARVGQLLGMSLRWAIAGALVWAFGTMALVYTQEIFAEPMMALGLVLALYGAMDSQHSRLAALWCGIGAALFVGGNLAAAVVLPVIGLRLVWGEFITRRQIQRSIFWLVPLLIGALIYVAFNDLRSGAIVSGGYDLTAQATGGSTGANSEGFSTPFFVGLSGLLISAYRGLLWYAPITILALPGVWHNRYSIRNRLFLALVTGIYIIPFSLWFGWAGGYTWGPRFLVPILPAMILLALPVIQSLWQHRYGRWLVGALLILSVYGQITGSFIHYSYYEFELSDRYGFALNDTPLQLPMWETPLIQNWRFFDPFDLWVVWDFGGRLWQGIALLMILVLQGGLLWRGIMQRDWLPGTRFIAVGSMFLSLTIAGLTATTIQQQNSSAALREFAATYPAESDYVLFNDLASWQLINIPQFPRTYSIPQDNQRYSRWVDGFIDQLYRAERVWFLTRAFTPNALEADFWQTTYAGSRRTIGDYTVTLFDTRQEQPPLQTIASVMFDRFRLEQIALERTADALYIAFYWQGDVPADGRLFVHLVDAEGHIIEQHDRLPLNGLFDESTDTMIDRHIFQLPMNADDSLRLRVGWALPDGTRIVPRQNNQPLNDYYLTVPVSDAPPDDPPR